MWNTYPAVEQRPNFSKSKESYAVRAVNVQDMDEQYPQQQTETRLMGCLHEIETELDEIDKLMAECGLDPN